MKLLRTRVAFRVIVAAVTAAMLVVASSADAQPGGGGGGKPRAAKLQLSPAKQSFGSAVVGTTGAPISFTVSNTGTASTGPLSFNVTGTNGGEFHAASGATNGCVSGTTALAPGASCKVDVRFAPTPPSGKKAATLNVADGPSTGAVKAALSGTATAPATLTLNPSSHDFGQAPGGGGSLAGTFTLTNNGSAPSSPVSFEIGGTNQSEFNASSVSPNGCASGTTTLAVGASCTIDTYFSPTDLGPGGAYGPRSATLQVSTNNPYEGAPTATLSGESTEPDYVSVSPATYDFGTVTPGETSTATFTVTNVGTHTTASLHTDTQATEFEIPIESNFCAVGAGTLDVGDSCTFDVTFAPTSSDAQSTELLVWTGGTTSFARSNLSGNNPAACTVTSNSGCLAFDNEVVTYGTKTYTLNGTVVLSPTCQYLSEGCDYSDYNNWYSGSGTFSVDDGATNIDSGTWTARYYDSRFGPEYDDADLNVTTCPAAAIRLLRFIMDFHGGTGDWQTNYVALRQDASNPNPPKSYVELNFVSLPVAGDFQGTVDGVTITC